MGKVQAYVYDITQGMAARMSRMLLGKQIDIVPHTGIVVFGKEYFFGSGPCTGEPGISVPVPLSQVLDLGETTKTREELEIYIQGVLAHEYTPENYNLLRHNCNHFADAVAKFLLDGKGLPDSIVNVADEALATPRGQSLRAMIESMERNMRANMGGTTSLNPFGDVGATAPPAASQVDHELEAALRDIASSNSVEARRDALQTLLKITENIDKNPAEAKFRQIKMANAAFAKKVASCAGGVEAMVAAGWLPDCTPEGEDVWVLGEEAVARQALPRRRFAEELAKLPAAPAAPAAAPAAAAPRAAPAAPAAAVPGGLPAGFPGGLPGGLGGLPGGLGGLPGGMNPAMMQQMLQNPAMLQQAQQMMQGNPQMAAQVQQMMQDPQMMAQVQQMMQNPQLMAQMQQMMGGMGGGPGSYGGY